MNVNVLFREELDALIECVRALILRPPADLNEMGKMAQIHLLLKLEKMRENAPSMMAS